MSQSRCRLPEAYIWKEVVLEEAGCCGEWKLRRFSASAAGKGTTNLAGRSARDGRLHARGAVASLPF